MEYWEDRLVPADHDKASKALAKFRRKKRRTKADEHILYDALTALGVTAEEADEIVSLEVSGGI
jgi:hypothetical protein